jgi:phosphoglycolate phosphatase-like HAD superfamily hydrolase
MIKLVIFDFDDTLCLTEPGCFELENTVAAHLGLPRMERETHLRTWGKPLEEVLPIRFPGVDVERFMAQFKTLIPGFVAQGLIDSIPEKNLDMLDRLRRMGRGIAVLTSRLKFECGHLLAPGGCLEGRIDRFYFKESYRYTKPDPRVFLGVLEDFDLLSHEAVYVGDSPGDAACAKGAGLNFFACLESGCRSTESFPDDLVDDFLVDLAGITGALERIEGRTVLIG